MEILVIDIGGGHVKCATSSHKRVRRFRSGGKMGPEEMVHDVMWHTSDWHYDVVSIGYPGVVKQGSPAIEPHNLGPGWVGFDFEAAFGHPVRMINDAAMQALGAYQGGTMLFLGLGTGLGSAMIVEGTIVPMELGHFRRTKRREFEEDLGERGRRRLGNEKWRRQVAYIVEQFRDALLPDYIVLGGGNAERIKRLPPRTRRGSNADAIRGGLRLWEEPTRA